MNSKQFATVLVITFIVGMIWLGADIWRNTKASVPVSDKLQAALEQVTPTFNNRVLDIIDKEVLSKNDVSVSNAPLSAPNLNEEDNGPTPSSATNESSPAAQPSGGSLNSAPPSSSQSITPIVTFSPTPAASITSGGSDSL